MPKNINIDQVSQCMSISDYYQKIGMGFNTTLYTNDYIRVPWLVADF